jgi:hypothetical protein
VFIKPLPNNERRDTFYEILRTKDGEGIHKHRDWWKGFMKHAMGSVLTIYIPSFIKIGSGIQKLTEWIQRHTDTQTA